MHVPDLAYAPAEAISQLEALIPSGVELVLVGSSLGGFYANYLAEKYSCKAVLVNPAVYPYNLLDDFLGEQHNPYSGETYTLNKQHMDQLRALFVANMQRPQNRMVLVQTGDEALDYRQAEAYFKNANCIVEQGGDHGFVSFENWLPRIASFLHLE